MRHLDKCTLGPNEDWYGTNAAVTCYACGKVFLTSQVLNRRGRACPQCGACKVIVTKAGVSASEAGD